MKTTFFRWVALVLAVAGFARAQAVYTFGSAANVSSEWTAITDNGRTAGISYSLNNYSGAALANWTDGQHGAFELAGGANYDVALGYNNAGRVAGYSSATSGYRATYVDLSVSDTPNDMGTLGGTNSYAYGVNASGQIVGASQVAGDGAHNAFRWNSGTLSAGDALGTLGGANSYGYAINASGQIVGESQVSGGASHAFLTTATGSLSTATDIGTLGGTNSSALAVNASGQVVGYSQLVGTTGQHAFLYTSGATIDLGTTNGFATSVATGVTDGGLVVGYMDNAGNTLRHAFVYSGGTMLDLNLLDISGLPAGWYLEQAYAVNNSGVIVGDVRDSSNIFHPFTLTPTGVPLPIPEPSTYAALAGLSALGLALWRRVRGDKFKIQAPRHSDPMAGNPLPFSPR